MAIILLDLYERMYWDRRRISLVLDPAPPTPEDYSHFHTPLTASGANSRPVLGGDPCTLLELLQKRMHGDRTRRQSAPPVQAGGFYSCIVRRLDWLTHHLLRRRFSPRRRKLTRRKWGLVVSGLFFSWWRLHNHVFNALSKLCWGLYKHTHIRAIYVIDTRLIWPAWYFWNEQVFDPLTYQVWWPIKHGFIYYFAPWHNWVFIGLALLLLSSYRRRMSTLWCPYCETYVDPKAITETENDNLACPTCRFFLIEKEREK